VENPQNSDGILWKNAPPVTRKRRFPAENEVFHAADRPKKPFRNHEKRPEAINIAAKTPENSAETTP
jgi:hypothetical protein